MAISCRVSRQAVLRTGRGACVAGCAAALRGLDIVRVRRGWREVVAAAIPRGQVEVALGGNCSTHTHGGRCSGSRPSDDPAAEDENDAQAKVEKGLLFGSPRIHGLTGVVSIHVDVGAVL